MSAIPILTPDNSFEMTCEDKTCGMKFHMMKAMPEILNSTAIIPLVLFHQVPGVCPRCGAIYKLAVSHIETKYVVVRMDQKIDLVPGLPSLVTH